MLALVPRAAALLIRTLHATCRVRHVDDEAIVAMNREQKRYVLALWHGHLLLMIKSRLVTPLTAMISQHRDGELIARTMEYFGVTASRGSTTRGGSGALKEMIRIGGSGSNLAITPDGPKGPPRIAQVGVVLAAQATGLPVMPVAFAAKKKSSCAPGTAFRSRAHSRKSSISTVSRWRSLAGSRRPKPRSGAGESNGL